ncbi:MAG: hypothetical protein ACPG5L_06715 [Vibrio gallaecicus]|uniref:Uncharacterized protein n=2 Tax=Vibrio gallaecicus TaxID=552386 RepID=A0ABV4N8I7_9VIBR|nr:hypothetical protein [Vibrio gallaecicus]MDN3615007.1 hypothetical protein [Vibrio gallaecicus]
MMNVRITAVILGLSTILIGCANDAPLGSHVAKLRVAQTYDPNATQDNLGIVPDGNGERTEGAYQAYTGKESSSLQGSSESQVLEGFN